MYEHRQLLHVAISFVGISCSYCNAMIEVLISSFITLLKQELDKPEWRQEVLRPLIRWLATGILPYVVALICLNFFLTIAAVSLVLYLYRP